MDALRASATIASTLLVFLCVLLRAVGGGGNGVVRVGIVSAEEEIEGRMTADGCGQVPSISLRDVMG
jgi:hypothetical protein